MLLGGFEDAVFLVLTAGAPQSGIEERLLHPRVQRQRVADPRREGAAFARSRTVAERALKECAYLFVVAVNEAQRVGRILRAAVVAAATENLTDSISNVHTAPRRGVAD
ncbi:hypothetical protein WPS_31540 [Vulcanimicrobium alpinum]|uniref:Uncharacterized protein n=1 Tax=Vulcanimicrobium alpinum TaxID=3016050 RepID=A0AAN1XYT7_UNVUL|nr:hypothetical protein WPS_31540 [Vulcanimicrobium alpinum]